MGTTFLHTLCLAHENRKMRNVAIMKMGLHTQLLVNPHLILWARGCRGVASVSWTWLAYILNSECSAPLQTVFLDMKQWLPVSRFFLFVCLFWPHPCNRGVIWKGGLLIKRISVTFLLSTDPRLFPFALVSDFPGLPGIQHRTDSFCYTLLLLSRVQLCSVFYQGIMQHSCLVLNIPFSWDETIVTWHGSMKTMLSLHLSRLSDSLGSARHWSPLLYSSLIQIKRNNQSSTCL